MKNIFYCLVILLLLILSGCTNTEKTGNSEEVITANEPEYRFSFATGKGKNFDLFSDEISAENLEKEFEISFYKQNPDLWEKKEGKIFIFYKNEGGKKKAFRTLYCFGSDKVSEAVNAAWEDSQKQPIACSPPASTPETKTNLKEHFIDSMEQKLPPEERAETRERLKKQERPKPLSEEEKKEFEAWKDKLSEKEIEEICWKDDFMRTYFLEPEINRIRNKKQCEQTIRDTQKWIQEAKDQISSWEKNGEEWKAQAKKRQKTIDPAHEIQCRQKYIEELKEYMQMTKTSLLKMQQEEAEKNNTPAKAVSRAKVLEVAREVVLESYWREKIKKH